MDQSAVWIDRIRARSTRLLTSDRFRRWAASFPLTRPIARRRARALFDLCAGFVYSQVLLACVRLDVFAFLHDRAQTLDELARQTALPTEAARKLLDAAVSLRLLSRDRRGRYALGALGVALVDNPAVVSMIKHHSLLYDDLRDPVQLLRHGSGAGALAAFWPYATTARPAELDAQGIARYSALMTASQPLVAGEVLDAYALDRHACLLDVGGGEGAFLAMAAERNPALRLMLFDLPAVAERARSRLAAAGLADRASVSGGSFLTHPLPRGADVVSLVRVLHDHDDASVLKILAAVRAALPEHGTLLIAEPMAGAAATDAMADAYFGFYLLAMGSGRARSAAELGELLKRTGFDGGRLLATRLPIQTSLIVARTVPFASLSVNKS